MSTRTIASMLLADLDEETFAALAQRLRPYLYAADASTLLTPAEAAQGLGVHPRTLTRAAAAGRVEGATRVGKGWRFRASESALHRPPAARQRQRHLRAHDRRRGVRQDISPSVQRAVRR